MELQTESPDNEAHTQRRCRRFVASSRIILRELLAFTVWTVMAAAATCLLPDLYAYIWGAWLSLWVLNAVLTKGNH